MRSLWPDLYASAASAACSAPNLATKEPSAWLPPSSATNSFAATKRSSEFREGKFPASWFTPAQGFAAAKIRRPNLQHSHGLAATRFLEKLPGLAAGRILDDFLARSLRRRAG